MSPNYPFPSFILVEVRVENLQPIFFRGTRNTARNEKSRNSLGSIRAAAYKVVPPGTSLVEHQFEVDFSMESSRVVLGTILVLEKRAVPPGKGMEKETSLPAR